MIYRYFVSYFGKRKDGDFVIGNRMIERMKPIKEADDIIMLQADIEKDNEYDVNQAVVLNYKLMAKMRKWRW